MPKFLQDASHPGVCIAHIGFKLAAMVSYMLLNFFVGNLVLTYIVVLILAVVDFWVVKNVTGR